MMVLQFIVFHLLQQFSFEYTDVCEAKIMVIPQLAQVHQVFFSSAGFKFDLRLYVGVTCYDPVRIYLYEEGLTRCVVMHGSILPVTIPPWATQGTGPALQARGWGIV